MGQVGLAWQTKSMFLVKIATGTFPPCSAFKKIIGMPPPHLATPSVKSLKFPEIRTI